MQAQHLRMIVDGASALTLMGDGSLRFRTSIGDAYWAPPTAYQMMGSIRIDRPVEYVLIGNLITFSVSNILPNVPLVIVATPPLPPPAPATDLHWSTYLKGPGLNDEVRDLWMDDAENIYVTGTTFGNFFPTTPGLDNQYGGFGDAFATKLNSGRGIVWSTYYGGSSFDKGTCIAANAQEEVYVAGITASPDFPICLTCTTQNLGSLSLQSSVDAFILKFTDDGQIQDFAGSFATFFGGITDEEPHDLYISPTEDHVYMVGYVDLPHLSGFPYMTSSQGGYSQPFALGTDQDGGFVLEISPNNSLLWCSNIGGLSATAGEEANALYVDDSRIYVVGSTPCSGSQVLAAPVANYLQAQGFFPRVHPGGSPFIRDNSGGTDMFIMEFDVKHKLLWSTLVGGPGQELNSELAHNDNGITKTPTGDLFVTGSTQSTLTGSSFPAFPIVTASGTGVYNQATHGGGNWDAYLMRFNAQRQLTWSTLYGGNQNDYGRAVSSRGPSDIHLVGFVVETNGQTPTFPTLPVQNQYYQAALSGSADAFLVRFRSSGVRQYASLFGGPGYEYAYAVANDAATSDIVMAGRSGSVQFPFKDIPGNSDYYYYIAASGDAFITNWITTCVGCARQASHTPSHHPPHPNPTHGLISWNFDTPYSGTVAVWSLTGQRLETVSVAGRTRVEIDLQAYPPGLYLLRREDGRVAKVLRE
ncbi:MAG: hypothetical protein D6722_28325 [Bacteroidetes bacterium]|nr:MAG: hypothetical protein D6722_28325 [Bacteroidota bacterium]